MAADVDASGHVSVNDLLALKDIVLRNHYELPTETSWRFVDAAFDFGNGENPLAQTLPESYSIPLFDSDMIDLNFIGVKLGDLTGDYENPDGLAQNETRADDQTLLVRTSKANYKRGETVTVELTLDGSDRPLQAIQYTLEFDQQLLRYKEINELSPDGSEPATHNLSNVDKGLINGLWFDVKPLEGERTIVTITFEALSEINSNEMLRLGAKPTQTLAYLDGGVETSVTLELEVTNEELSGQQSVDDRFTVGTNYPNPFNGLLRKTALWQSKSLMPVAAF